MRRRFLVALIAVIAGACGGGDATQQNTQPTPDAQSRDAPLSNNSVPSLLGPAQRARDTANNAESRQNQMDQQSNSGYP
jgi:hypothetical protein